MKPKRLADVIEEYTADNTPIDEPMDSEDRRKFAEGLEKHLRENFLILAKELSGKK